VPIIAEVRPMVTERLDSATGPDARLFTGPRGGRISTAVLRDATHWDEVVTKLGFEHLRRHDLRHTGLTWLADAGVLPHVLRKIAGHGSLTTTQRYLHPDQHSINEAGNALNAHLRAPTVPRCSPATCRLSRANESQAVHRGVAWSLNGPQSDPSM
jgi:integrase